MKIIISPAKKMNREVELLTSMDAPIFLEDTSVLMKYMQGLSLQEAQALWNCNEQLAEQNFKRFQSMDLHKNLTPAILSYEGIQYQYMAPTVFESSMLAYIQENLRILSGFYGVLKPMDGVTPYRLEMQARLSINHCKGLYEYWGNRIYKEITNDTHIIINLASKEYSKCVEKYLQPEDIYITCSFMEEVKGKLVQKATYAKMARGEMVRFMAENNINKPEEMKKFNRLGYQFYEEGSTETEYIFLK